MNKLHMFAAASLALFANACAGGRTNIVAPDARYPVSMTAAVRDTDGTLVSKDRKVLVGRMEDERRSWGMVYSAVKLNPKQDISQLVNRQVRASGGDAVVNLQVASSHCGWNFVPLLNLLPVWPGCTIVHLRGDIVRVGEKRDEAALARGRAEKFVGLGAAEASTAVSADPLLATMSYE